jgi:hypothetical protein
MTEVREYTTRDGYSVLGFQIAFDVAVIPCPDCDGIGDFELPDSRFAGECVKCKSQGVTMLTAYGL